jgi:hypothetical protein
VRLRRKGDLSIDVSEPGTALQDRAAVLRRTRQVSLAKRALRNIPTIAALIDLRDRVEQRLRPVADGDEG